MFCNYKKHHLNIVYTVFRKSIQLKCVLAIQIRITTFETNKTNVRWSNEKNNCLHTLRLLTQR